MDRLLPESHSCRAAPALDRAAGRSLLALNLFLAVFLAGCGESTPNPTVAASVEQPAAAPLAPKGWVQPVALEFTEPPRELPVEIAPSAAPVITAEDLRRLPAVEEEAVAPIELAAPSPDTLELRRLPPVEEPPLPSAAPPFVPGEPIPPSEPAAPSAPEFEAVEQQAPPAAPPAMTTRPAAPRQPIAVTLTPQQRAGLRIVEQQARQYYQHGCQLAERGAYFSARAEFIHALRLAAQALDGITSTNEHSQALALGLRAIREADDFAPQGSELEAELNLRGLVAAHRTPVLKEADLTGLTPLAALQTYYTFAQQQLAAATGGLPAASEALYGLGRLQMMLVDGGNGGPGSLSGPRSLVYHQAALLANSQNYLAANEMGVLLARFGQYGDARRVLEHSVRVGRLPEAWHNLSVVYERIGSPQLAQQARQEMQLAMRGGGQSAGAPAGDLASRVQWLEPQAFAATGPNPTGAAPARTSAKPAARDANPSAGAQPVAPGGEEWRAGVRR